MSRTFVEKKVESYCSFAGIDRVYIYWGVCGPMIDIVKKTMYMPIADLNKGIDYLNFAPPHEVGHPVICPKNAQWAYWMNRLAEKLGYYCPIDFANTISDIIVNDWNLTVTPWKRSFIKGAQKFYRKQLTEIKKDDKERNSKGAKLVGNDKRIRFLVEIELQRIRELLGKKLRPFSCQEYEDAYQILFNNEMEWQDKYRECAILLKQILKGSKYDKMPSNSSRKKRQSKRIRKGDNTIKIEPGSGTPNARADTAIFPEELPVLDPDKDKKEWEKFQAAIRALGGEELQSMVANIIHAGTEAGYFMPNKEAMEFAFDCCEIAAFSEFILANDVMKRANIRRGKKGPRVEQMWDENDDPELLDMEATFERYGGVLIPGETMVKRVDGDLLDSDDGGTGTLFLLLDTSGSMQVSIYQLLTISWGAILAAKKAGDEIAIMIFDNSATYKLEPTKNYTKAKAILRSLSISGGTRLMPALTQIEQITIRRSKKPTVLIITDCEIYERDEVIIPPIQKIEKLGGKVMICNVREANPQWVVNANKAGIECFNVTKSDDVKKVIVSTFNNVVVKKESTNE